MNTHELVEQLAETVVGRRREIDLVVAALAADRHILLEGPPGTGKPTLLRAVAHELGIGFEFVEGNAELTPARLVGHFDPARVLADGYDPDVFVDGPLAAALRSGSLFYVEELNRVPDTRCRGDHHRARRVPSRTMPSCRSAATWSPRRRCGRSARPTM